MHINQNADLAEHLSRRLTVVWLCLDEIDGGDQLRAARAEQVYAHPYNPIQHGYLRYPTTRSPDETLQCTFYVLEPIQVYLVCLIILPRR